MDLTYGFGIALPLQFFMYMGRLLLAILFFPVFSFAQCDSSLWNHVYHASRLSVHNDCTTVTGTIERLIYESDGDIHIRIRLDTVFNWMLNVENFNSQYGCLVAEPVCATTVTYSNAVAACAGFTNTVYIPNVGERVAVTGSFVTDTYHGWNEIHPVSSIVHAWPAGVTSTTKPLTLKVFPNPSHNKINFELSERPSSTVFLVILDAVGRLAGQYQLSETTLLTVTTSYLPKGTYYYHLEQNSAEQMNGNFVVQ